MSYLHVSLVHSASASLGLPEAAGCFPPRVDLHTNRGEKMGSQRVPLSQVKAPGSLAGRGPLTALRAAGNCSSLGVLKADTGEQAEEARSPGGHALPQAQVLLAGRL